MAKGELAGGVSNLIVISDTHAGSLAGLCPPDGVKLDGTGRYAPSIAQQKMFAMWTKFWMEWVPRATKGEPFAIIHNGDALDGKPHGSVAQIADNPATQAEIAYRLLMPLVEMCKGRYYHIRGTEAHVGKSAAEEERLAQRLGAVAEKGSDLSARFAMWFKIEGKVNRPTLYDMKRRDRKGVEEAWRRLTKTAPKGKAWDLAVARGEAAKGQDGGLVHLLHHIGTTSSSAHESSAVNAELASTFNEAGRWGNRPPDVVVRSHRHRSIEVRLPSGLGYAMAFVTPAWQLMTPFAFKVPGARVSQPQLGGSMIRMGDEELHARHCVWQAGRPVIERCAAPREVVYEAPVQDAGE